MGTIQDRTRDALVARVLSPLTAPDSGWAQALRQDPVARLGWKPPQKCCFGVSSVGTRRQLLQLAVDAGWCRRYDCNDKS